MATNSTILNKFDASVFSEITDYDATLSELPWLAVPTIIEPDNWSLFWDLWNKHKIPSNDYSNVWDSMTIWVNPSLSEHQVRYDYPQTYKGYIHDWSKIFPEMFEKIFSAMPHKIIEKITLASNTKRVPVHVDSSKTFYPWPNTMRVMLWDSNDHPTFYMSSWPKEHLHSVISDVVPGKNKNYFVEEPAQEEKYYVDLPTWSNTFVYSNGVYLHGADLAKPKIIMLIWGIPDAEKWKQRLREILNK